MAEPITLSIRDLLLREINGFISVRDRNLLPFPAAMIRHFINTVLFIRIRLA